VPDSDRTKNLANQRLFQPDGRDIHTKWGIANQQKIQPSPVMQPREAHRRAPLVRGAASPALERRLSLLEEGGAGLFGVLAGKSNADIR
jgi:hypothetical protein